jgi:phospholipase A-2-activating protein
VITTCYIPSSDRFPDGLIATGGNDKTICVYSAKQGIHLFTLEGHEQAGKDNFFQIMIIKSNISFLFKVSCLSHIPQSDLLLSGSWDSTGRIWSLSNKQCIQTLKGIYIIKNKFLFLKLFFNN